jgi:YfiH family protein
MHGTRHIHLDVPFDRSFIDIPLGHPADTTAGDDSGWRAVISLHAAGHMGRDSAERRQNRTRLQEGLCLEPRRVFGLTQIHSRLVLVVEPGDDPAACVAREADGLVTEDPDAILSVTAADCLPIFLFSKQTGARALVHSGWKGTGIVSRAIALLEERYHVNPADLEAVLGPGIGACCYEVDVERHRAFTGEFGPAAGGRRRSGFTLDLRQANIDLLLGRGVRSITVIDNCTCCEPRFGSYRRDGKDRFHNMVALFGRF